MIDAFGTPVTSGPAKFYFLHTKKWKIEANRDLIIFTVLSLISLFLFCL